MWGDTLGGSGVEEVGEAAAELGVAVDLGDFDVGYELADADVLGQSLQLGAAGEGVDPDALLELLET